MNCTRTNQRDSVVVCWSSSITLWVVPLHYNSDIVRTIVNIWSGVLRSRWKTWKGVMEYMALICILQSHTGF